MANQLETERAIARDYEQKARAVLAEFCDISTEARQKHGLSITFSIDTDPSGITKINAFDIVKPMSMLTTDA